jgi:hypothetical protein
MAPATPPKPQQKLWGFLSDFLFLPAGFLLYLPQDGVRTTFVTGVGDEWDAASSNTNGAGKHALQKANGDGLAERRGCSEDRAGKGAAQKRGEEHSPLPILVGDRRPEKRRGELSEEEHGDCAKISMVCV